MKAATGMGFTTTGTDAVEEHPNASLAVTVKVVVVSGDTVTDEPVIFPGLHV